MTEPASSSSAAPPEAAAAAPAAADWKAGLPSELQPLAATKGWKRPADALKSYVHLEKLVGADRIALPPKTRDGGRDWSAWDGWSALGRPEAPENYAFRSTGGAAFTEADRAFQAHMAPLLHKAGLAQWQVDLLAEGFDRFGAQARADEERRGTAHAAETEAALRRDWGAGYERQIALANRALRQFGGPAAADALNQAGLGRHPAVVRAFARIGTALAEDGSLAGQTEGETASAAAEIQRLKSDREFQAAFLDRLHPGHAAAMARMLRLQARVAATADADTEPA